MKKFHSFFLSVILLFVTSGSFTVYAEEEYCVYDLNDGFETYFDSYTKAYSFYKEHLEEHDNLLLSDTQGIIQMEYGIVEFLQSSDLSYQSELKGREDELNGIFAADALYLSTNSQGTQVTFMLSQDTGILPIEEVKLHPYETVRNNFSHYVCKDGKLVHLIKTDLSISQYTYCLVLDDALPYMQENTSYYSYDGHYFYDDFKQMSDDLRQKSHEHSLNQEAYYNYYQYLPFHNITAYSDEDLQLYFQDILSIDGKLEHFSDRNHDLAADEINRSQLHGEASMFFACQDVYGTNAMMLASTAISESNYGRSRKSFMQNNLFHNAAYDSEKQRKQERYPTVDDSILSFSRYFISGVFSKHLRKDYSGTCFGNKASGINVTYSKDPYNGEKCASSYYQLDEALGFKDNNRYAIGIISKQSRVSFYRDEEMKDLLFTLRDVSELSYIILKESEEAYKIQVDDSFSDDGFYDFDTSVAYVTKDAFSLILNPDKIDESEYNCIQLDFNGGSFCGKGSLLLREGSEKHIVPEKEGYEFIGYDDDHLAQYKKIQSIELFGETEIDMQNLDLSGLTLKVEYDGGDNESYPLTSDMIDEIDEDLMRISYHGLTCERRITNNASSVDTKQKLLQLLKKKDYDSIRSYIDVYYEQLGFEQIREIDHELKQKDERNYVIKDDCEIEDISITGLDLSLPEKSDFRYVNDTYYILIDQIREDEKETVCKVSQAYGFKEELGFSISFQFNYQKIELQSPIILQVPIEENDRIYTVYHLNENEDVIKCPIQRSESYLQFMAFESGSYIILSKTGYNIYEMEDQIEELSKENMGIDNHRINVDLLLLAALLLEILIAITVYYIVRNKREILWRDFRKSLPTADFAQEEKPKN